MGVEARVQSKLIKWLREEKGCYVIKVSARPGVPRGCPDIIFMREGFWGAIECKSYTNSAYQPGQKATIEKLNNWSYARVCHSDNYNDIVSELNTLLN